VPNKKVADSVADSGISMRTMAIEFHMLKSRCCLWNFCGIHIVLRMYAV